MSKYFTAPANSSCCVQTRSGMLPALLGGCRKASLCIQCWQAGIQVVNHSWELLGPSGAGSLTFSVPQFPPPTELLKRVQNY